jgi:methylated-DNA-protein-cysteine methyltransferase related protein
MRLTRVASDNYQRIYAVVRRIPRGRVASYGQVAELAGIPRHARQVGYALHHLPSESEVPWQRVLNAAGEVAKRAYPEDARWQRDLLEEEGVEFDARGRVLPRFFWKPKRRD